VDMKEGLRASDFGNGIRGRLEEVFNKPYNWNGDVREGVPSGVQ
jgi:hypothetical protein